MSNIKLRSKTERERHMKNSLWRGKGESQKGRGNSSQDGISWWTMTCKQNLFTHMFWLGNGPSSCHTRGNLDPCWRCSICQFATPPLLSATRATGQLRHMGGYLTHRSSTAILSTPLSWRTQLGRNSDLLREAFDLFRALRGGCWAQNGSFCFPWDWFASVYSCFHGSHGLAGIYSMFWDIKLLWFIDFL